MSATRAGVITEFGAALPRDPRLRLALRMAQLIRVGTLTVVLPDGTSHRVIASEAPTATIVIRHPRAITRLAIGGSLGLAEAYLEDLWESPEIRDVMTLAAANEAQWEPMLRGRPWVRAASWLLHRLRPNTRGGAARNIIDHYDLGNEFFSRWLDPSLTYSAAMFAEPAEDLQAAQQRKMRQLCERLELRPGMRLLEIGCGWGGFAAMAARDYGAQVVGITLSPSQLAMGQARLAEQGLADKVELRLQDYRDVQGSFDRIASIEMFEAVGRRFWPAYFSTLRERLVPGGLAGIQTITIADRLWDEYVSTADFIQRHVFPGGMLPTPSRLRDEVTAAGLQWRDAHWFGADYARTLDRWYASFQHAWPDIARLPQRYDARFKRLWEYYLAYCRTGFSAGWTDVGQVILARPA